MSFNSLINQYKNFNVGEFCASVTPGKIETILERDTLTEKDYLALLSDAAAPFLEPMARKADELTRRHFGNVVFIFTPLYISNYCDNSCAYCSFGRQQEIKRRHLSPDEIRAEAERISANGIRHILVLTGEARGRATPSYCEAAVRILRDYFSSIAVEIYPLTEEEYGGIIGCGADGLTIYQETYDEERYAVLHKGGPKQDYGFRLEAPERACRQGMRAVTVGALSGLSEPVKDAFFAGLHAAYLQKIFPDVEVSISFPRLRPLVADFRQGYEVNDCRLVQMMVAARLFLPFAGITLSTRESASFRNAALRLGVTRMSAGVSTAVGGRTSPEATPQFEIADTRTVDEVKRDLLDRGFQPVMHDWNGRYVRTPLPIIPSPPAERGGTKFG
ncbi:MAG: 2-iminoacetate synthase ThiH [Chitinispirillaceae bacterium]|jgi:2-iminoacetate synthase